MPRRSGDRLRCTVALKGFMTELTVQHRQAMGGDARRHGKRRNATETEGKVSVRIHLPAPELRAFVTFYYFVDAFEPLTDLLYPEWGNVRFSLSGEWMVLNDPRDPAVAGRSPLFGPTDRRGKI